MALVIEAMPRSPRSSSSKIISLMLLGQHRPVEIDFGQRKSVYINVFPDGRILVRAPRWVDITAVRAVLDERRAWMEEKLAEYASAGLQRLEWRAVDGAELLYLGRMHKLRIIHGGRSGVSLQGSTLLLSIAAESTEADCARELERWLQRRARRVLTARLALCHGRCKAQIPLALPDLLIRHYKRSWGRCAANGLVSLNSELMKTPLACIDYVIVHELCHLMEHNHSPRFYALLTRCMPDWKERKARLDKYIL